MNDELFTQRDIDVDLADDWRRCFAISFRDENEMSRCHSNRRSYFRSLKSQR